MESKVGRRKESEYLNLTGENNLNTTTTGSAYLGSARVDFFSESLNVAEVR